MQCAILNGLPQKLVACTSNVRHLQAEKFKKKYMFTTSGPACISILLFSSLGGAMMEEKRRERER